MPARSRHPAWGGLLGAVLGLAGALLVGASRPDLAVLSCAAAGAIAATLASRAALASDPLVSTLVGLAVLRFGILAISRNPVLGAPALAVATVLLAHLARALLRRRRVRRIVSRR